MAKSQRDLKGWQFNLEGSTSASNVGETPSTPSRRSSRRNRTSTSTDQELILKRESDNLEVKKGSMLLVEQTDALGKVTSEIALVKEIKLGNVKFIDLVVLWFIQIGEIEKQFLPKVVEYEDESKVDEQEVFITEYKDEIMVLEIIKSVTVLSQDEYTKNGADVFLCRRACDTVGETFSNAFNFKEILAIFDRDLAEFIEFIRYETVPLKYKSKNPVRRITKKTVVKEPIYAESGDELDSESDAEITDVDDDDDDLALEEGEELEGDELRDTVAEIDSDDEYLSKRKSRGKNKDKEKKTITKALKKSTSSKRKEPSPALELTPRKRGRQSAASSPSKLHNDDRKVINSMLSPLKKRLRLKGDLTKPSLSPSKPQQLQLKVAKGKSIQFNDSPLAIDSTSEIFKELKAKLHTSMRLTSLPCREDEFTSIYLNLESAIQEQTGCCLYVSGTPGVGKTATIREVIAQLKDLIPTQELPDFDYVEINGLKLLTPQVAYEILWEKVSGLNVSASNAALLLESYFKIEEEDQTRKPLVVLMDELDQIVTKKQNVMYNFFNWPTYRYLKLIVIAVANTMDLPERVLSNKISSRLGLRRIQFIGYTYEQLGIIIKHRLDMISKLNSKRKRKVLVNEDAVSFASRKVASVSGDARRALTICRRAVEMAEREYNQKVKVKPTVDINADDGDGEDQDVHVSISHISKAINETINSPISQFLTALPFDHKLVLVGVLLRIRRSGLAENSLGDIIDEMKNTLSSLAPKIINGDGISVLDLLYGEGLIHMANSQPSNIRVLKFKQVVNELVESGILLQQNIKGERHRMIHLNISEEEILTVLKRDKEISGMF